jgi:hypothetical protein
MTAHTRALYEAYLNISNKEKQNNCQLQNLGSRKYKDAVELRRIEKITISSNVEIDICISKRPARHGIPTDSNGSNWPNLRKEIIELSF